MGLKLLPNQPYTTPLRFFLLQTERERLVVQSYTHLHSHPPFSFFSQIFPILLSGLHDETQQQRSSTLRRKKKMGKYMRKSKPAGDVAVMEVSQAASLGVRTRAKTLALQRSSSSYLQLRSRRLEKPPILVPKRHHNKHHHTPKQQQQPSAAEPSPTKPEDSSPPKEEEQKKNSELNDGGEEEASFGENVLEFEGRERWVFSLGIFFLLIFLCLLKFGKKIRDLGFSELWSS